MGSNDVNDISFYVIMIFPNMIQIIECKHCYGLAIVLKTLCITDNGGLREAWRAYNHHLANNGNSEPSLPGLSKYNNKQIFFMSYASMWCTVQDVQYTIGQLVQDVHPPNWVRVTATLQNMEEFAQTFGCQKGDPMVEDKPCRMW